MQNTLQAYLGGGLLFILARVLSAIAGAVSLFFLSALLSKEQLGSYAFVMAAFVTAVPVATLGLERTLLLRIAPMRRRPDRLKGGGLARRAMLTAAAGGAVIALALTAAAETARAGTMALAAIWLPLIALVVPLDAISAVQRAWLEANHRPALANLSRGLPDVARCLLLGAASLAGLGLAGVGLAAVLAAAVPVVFIACVAWGRTLGQPSRLRPAAFSEGAIYAAGRLLFVLYRQLDLLLVGILLPADRAAEYAVASRLALLAELVHQAVLPAFVPRARGHLASRNTGEALSEYGSLRFLSLAAAILVALALLILGQPLLALLGPYGPAHAPMLVLAAAHIHRIAYGPMIGLMTACGDTRRPLLVTLGTIAALAAALPPLVGRADALGAAFAVLVASATIVALGAAALRAGLGLRAADAPVALVAILAAAALVGAAVAALEIATAAAILVAALALLLVIERRHLRDWSRWADSVARGTDA
jgi:O-antigen/teichoic acid export membrane protein